MTFLPAVYLEDLADVAQHVHVQLLTLPSCIHRYSGANEWPVPELNSAFAGNGLSVDYMNSKDIKAQFFDRDDGYSTVPWTENVFSILTTNNTLTAHVRPLAFAPHLDYASGIANFSLYLPVLHLPASDLDPDIQANRYRSEVRLALRSVLLSNYRSTNLGRVGEGAHNEMFDKVLREVLAAQSTERLPQFWSLNPVFAAARDGYVFQILFGAGTSLGLSTRFSTSGHRMVEAGYTIA
jgi:hypothetical protein